ncbi:substrate-binding domain-containing protein [Consotaella salsifontis]|uniref:Transcriptional regulator, LacI family n=1 Tax=Consotaella salsifontis TaxID=1365950 RepID=A0A1T4S6Q3_9HYPH|nr:substrate-binding domain-containing protein [Consotaella salsifontis]SKA23915.1 transcriptional regulator, LacI family [Consotaella salsifontis]
MSKTIDEIARETGYSRTTVTLVLKGQADRYRISGRTREIIERYVAEHGYVINQTARNLKLRRSHVIGFVVPDLSNAFFARLMAALEVRCRAEGLVLVTTSTSEEPAIEQRALDNLVTRGVDGLVIAPCCPRGDHALPLRKKRLPLVLIDRVFEGDKAIAILSDHFDSARTITREMIEGGAQDIAFLCGNPANPSIQERIRGFEAALAETAGGTGKGRVIAEGADTIDVGIKLVTRLFAEEGVRPQGILCSSLLILKGALHAIKSRYGRIPAGLVIGTFDYDAILEVLPNTVRAIRQDEQQLADAVFDCLLAQMNGQDAGPSRRIIPTTMIRLGEGALESEAPASPAMAAGPASVERR